MERIIVNRCAIDWITMTTKSEGTMSDTREFFVNSCEGAQLPGDETKRMQYTGRMFGPVWIGEGKQRGMMHYMVQVTGGEAEYVFPYLAGTGCKPTRIDVQYTLNEADTKAVRESLEAMPGYRDTDSIPSFLNHMYKKEKWNGRRKKTDVRTDQGFDTLYIGTRENSQRFSRVYVKELCGGEIGIRVELELKGKSAEAFVKSFNEGNGLRELSATWLKSEVDKWPDVCPLATLVRSRIESEANGAIMGTEIEAMSKDSQRTLEWIRSSVTPAVIRLMRDHDTKSSIIHWIISMNEQIEWEGHIFDILHGSG